MNKILWNFMNFWRILTHWHFINLFFVTNKIQPFQDSKFLRFKISGGKILPKICEILFLRFFQNWLNWLKVCLSVKVVFRKSKFLACRFFENWPIKWPCSTFLRFWFFCSVRDLSILKFGKNSNWFWNRTNPIGWSPKIIDPRKLIFIPRMIFSYLISSKLIWSLKKFKIREFSKSSRRHFGRNFGTFFSKSKMGHFRMNIRNDIFWSHFIFKGGETWC